MVIWAVAEISAGCSNLRLSAKRISKFGMPYIPPQDRKDLDPAIETLAEALRTESKEHGGDFEGLLNYVITKLVVALVPEKRYKFIARITGVLENVKQEFYRRFAEPYEDEQMRKSGDVY